MWSRQTCTRFVTTEQGLNLLSLDRMPDGLATEPNGAAIYLYNGSLFLYSIVILMTGRLNLLYSVYQ